MDEYSLNEVISGCIQFNKERNLLNQGCNDFRRLAFTLEEEIERCGLKDDKVLSRIEALRRLEQWEIWKKTPPDTKGYLAPEAIDGAMEKYQHKLADKPEDEEAFLAHQIDASVDKIIYEVGEIAKTIWQSLRMEENESLTEVAKQEHVEAIICQAFNTVMAANRTKWSKTDPSGQVTKDETFKAPEVLEKGIVQRYWRLADHDKN